MRRRSRILRVLKWVGTVSCALLAAALVASLWWSISYSRFLARPLGQIVLIEGGLFIISFHPSDDDLIIWRDAGAATFEGWGAELHDRGFTAECLWPDAFYFNDAMNTGICLPLWMPFVAILIPTFLLWRRDRRPPPGHCPRCGYNLTGLSSGRCPECGTVVASSR